MRSGRPDTRTARTGPYDPIMRTSPIARTEPTRPYDPILRTGSST
jgi:hypothetical protein